MFGGVVADVGKIAFLATSHETFRDRFQLLPARPDFLGFRLGDFVIRGGDGDDVEQVGEFLHNLVRGGNQIMRVGNVPGILNEEPAGALANPLDEPVVAGAVKQGFDAVKRVARAATGLPGRLVRHRLGVGGSFRTKASGVGRRLGPFVNHGKRQAEIGGDLFGRPFFENFAQQLVGLHDQTMKKLRTIGKLEADLPS